MGGFNGAPPYGIEPLSLAAGGRDICAPRAPISHSSSPLPSCLFSVIGYPGDPYKTVLLNYALGRIAAVVIGVVLSLLLAVLVFPRTATDVALQEMHGAVKGCVELHAASWEAIGGGWLNAATVAAEAAAASELQQQQQQGAVPGDGSSRDVDQAEVTVSVSGVLPTCGSEGRRHSEATQFCEKAHMAVAKALRGVEENMVVAENELIVGES